METESVIHIFGANGLIGSALACLLKESGRSFVKYSRQANCQANAIDISDKDGVQGLKGVRENDIVVNLAAIAQPTEVYRNKAAAYRVNVEGNRNLMLLAKNRGCKYFYMSSVEVFNGNKVAYSESDKTCPINEYGRQKKESEEEILGSYAGNSVIGRTSWNVSWTGQGRCFVDFMVNMLGEEHCVLAKDNLFTISCAMETAKVIISSLDLDFSGILHIASPQSISRVEVGQLIIDYLPELKDLKFTECLFDDILFEESRSRLNVLDTSLSFELTKVEYSKPYDIIRRKLMKIRDARGLSTH